MKRQALIIGAGGHCRVVVSLLRDLGEHNVLGIVDLAEPRVGEVIMEVPVIGSVTRIGEFRNRADLDVFLAIGDNALRRTWWQTVGDLGVPMPNLISPRAIVDQHARLGVANVVCARAFIGPGALIGDNNLINTAALIEHEVLLGNHCHLAPSSTVAGRSRVGCCCFIGAGATLIDNVEVGGQITIGAGATVVHSITDSGTYIGTPARRVDR